MTVLIAGSADTYYRSDRAFARLPHGRTFGQMRSVAVDSRGRVYVGHRPLLYGNLPPVAVFEPDGTYVGGWGTDVFLGIHQVYITPDDQIYIVDQDQHRIFRFDTAGRLQQTIGTGLPTLDAPFNNPTGMAVGPHGRLFISDGDSNTRVHVYSAEGDHISSWGTPGKSAESVTSPHSIAIDDEGLVYVGDRDASRVAVFTPEGEFVRAWGDVLHRPTSMWFEPGGDLWVADLVVRVHKYNKHGAVLARAHGALPLHSITGDKSGNLYLVGDLPNVEKWVRLTPDEAQALVPQPVFDVNEMPTE